MHGWVSIEDNKVVGFAGLYVYTYGGFTCIELAHLLVDKSYRGKLHGKELEEARHEFYMNIPDSVIFVSCVDNPAYSFNMKLKLGFIKLGIRTQYRPHNMGVGQGSIVMGKYNISSTKMIESGIPSEKTKKLMNEVLMNCDIDIKYRPSPNNKEDLLFKRRINQAESVTIMEDFKQSRIIAKIQNKISRHELFNVMARVSKSECTYKSCILNVINEQFIAIDKELINFGFNPVVFMPFYRSQFSKLEYQLL